MKKVLSLIAALFLVGTMNAQAQEKKFSMLAGLSDIIEGKSKNISDSVAELERLISNISEE